MTRSQIARFAGLLYLIIIICGIVDLVYIPSKLIVWQDPAKTVENIMNSELLFKEGVVCGIVTFLAFLLLSLVLYKLLKQVNKTHARLMVIFVLVSIPMSFINMLHKFSVLTLVNNPYYSQVLTVDQLQAQVTQQLEYFNNGDQLSYIFWGLWLFPFGYLVYKSGFLPKILGIFLMVGCFSHLIDFFGQFLVPGYSNSIIATIVGLPSTIGEFGICLWLLVVGTNKFNIGKRRQEPVYKS